MSDPTVTVELTREQLEELTERDSCSCNFFFKCKKAKDHKRDCWIGKALAELEGKCR